METIPYSNLISKQEIPVTKKSNDLFSGIILGLITAVIVKAFISKYLKKKIENS